MSTSPTYTIQVSSLSPTTSVETLSHFFSFCGKIDKIDHDQAGMKATVHFIKESAAKTALMLNGGTLDGSTISVTSDSVPVPAIVSKAEHQKAEQEEGEEHEVQQEDKPRSAVLAEYLAAGYQLSDQVIERGIQADQQYGISTRFLSIFNPLAQSLSSAAQPSLSTASAKLASVDEKQGISVKTKAAVIIGQKYYQAALSTPVGNKVKQFYTETSKQVRDVHEEAMRIRESKKKGEVGGQGEGEAQEGLAGVPEDKEKPVPSVGLASEKGASGSTTA